MNRHLNRKQALAWTATAAAAILCLALAPMAAAQDVAQVRTGSGSIEFEPLVEHGGLVLTVSGPDGFTHRAEFSASERPAFSIFDHAGGMLPDGSYTYELRVVPTNAQRREAFEANQLATRSRGGQGVARLVQSGSFAIVQGSIVAGGEREPDAGTAAGANALATKDQVIPDDLIVQGSLCVGFDCVNGEVFSFDTIRLKENNTRIDFTDTSSASGFPTEDWQLVANDSASGGRSAFIVQADGPTGSGDQILVLEAGADSNSIYVDSTNRVGFGTSTPVLDLHVATGNTPGLRLEQDSSSGFTAQTWDVAGNEANFFVRSVTTGSQLPFRIRPGAPTSSIDIANSGNVGMGTTAPSNSLHVVDAVAGVRIEGTSTGGSDHASLIIEQSGSSTPSEFEIRANATTGALEIKDSTSGGSALKFQQGAANNSIVVASAAGGNVRVGIGTATPQGNAGDNSLDVNGAIFQRGGQLHADYVFEPDYELESIDEHAAFMWENKHLPAVPPRRTDAMGREVVELGAHNRGIVEELEKAHIYIEQLHGELKASRQELSRYASDRQELARLRAELAELRNLVQTVAEADGGGRP